MSVTWESNLLSFGVSPELKEKIPAVIKECTKQGLDPFPLAIEEYTADEIAEIAAYGGFPVRYPHFSFGQSFESLYHQYHSGQGKIYEMVVNNDPTYMYLQRNNPVVDNVTVVAHALAHSDFFKNNIMFKYTNRNMMNIMANHGQKIRKYMDLYGQKRVLDYLDACLSINDLIDPGSVWKSSSLKKPTKIKFDELPEVEQLDKIKAPDYLDKFVNTEAHKDKQRKTARAKKKHARKTFPIKPQRDILLYILKYVPLEQWQQNILSMIRDEAIYFRPQIITKVMNEGWASYWDSYIMTKCNFAGDEGIFAYAKHHAGVLGGKYNLGNPYKLGVSLFNDIKERWDKGRFGREWEECDDYEKKKNWDTKAKLGRQKIFEVREHYNDVTFLNEFFTREFCHKNEFFEYALNKETNMYEIVSRDYKAIKQKLLKRHANGGKPILLLENLKHNNNEVMISHQFDGRPLNDVYIKGVMKMLYRIIKRPISVRTVVVEVIQSTQYDAPVHWSGSGMGYYSSPPQKRTDEITEMPVLYKYDGRRFQRHADTKTKKTSTRNEYII